jgi:hypothetical protein
MVTLHNGRLGTIRDDWGRLGTIGDNWVRVRASPNLVGTEPLRFRVQILEIGTKSDPFRFGSSLTAKDRYYAYTTEY